MISDTRLGVLILLGRVVPWSFWWRKRVSVKLTACVQLYRRMELRFEALERKSQQNQKQLRDEIANLHAVLRAKE